MSDNYKEMPIGIDFTVLFNSAQVSGITFEQRYNRTTHTTDVRIQPSEFPVQLTIANEALCRNNEVDYFASSVIEKAQSMRGRLLDGLGVPKMIKEAKEEAAKRERIAMTRKILEFLDEEIRLDFRDEPTLKFIRTMFMKLGA